MIHIALMVYFSLLLQRINLSEYITMAISEFEIKKCEKAIEKFLARAVPLHEQEQGEPFGSPRLGSYVQRWERWVRSMGVQHLTGSIGACKRL